jgi:pyruvate formate lyase activating enzyme
MSLHEALFYHKESGGLKCFLCPHNCLIKESSPGICGIRKNIGGVLYTDNYGQITSLAMDPIEKKPLYHFYPGSQILSIGTRGCNLKCPYCQNWSISQNISASSSYRKPEEIAALAVENNSAGIAYTYSEPVVWYEYVYDTALAARDRGIKNVMVTNGFINEKPLFEILPFIDAMNIDLKCYDELNYKKIHKGGLEPVKDTIKTAYGAGCFVEVTTLIVTGINDNFDEMMETAEFIASVNRGIPWHISRYHPSYKYNEPATSIEFMIDVYEAASEILDFVFTGNIHGINTGSDTVCPSCKNLVVSRSGYHTVIKDLNGSRCGNCGYDLGVRA